MSIRTCLLAVAFLCPVSAWSADLPATTAWDCLDHFVVDLAQREEVVQAVRDYNKAPADVHALDLLWPSFGNSDPDLNKVLQHPVARLLSTTIESVSYQGEGFLMGANGGLVAATEKTTDFWQGDETQFSDAVTLMVGQVHIEGETIDQSSHSMLIKISTPVYDPIAKQNIGVLMLGFDQFVVDFDDTCKKVDGDEPAPDASKP